MPAAGPALSSAFDAATRAHLEALAAGEALRAKRAAALLANARRVRAPPAKPRAPRALGPRQRYLLEVMRVRPRGWWRPVELCVFTGFDRERVTRITNALVARKLVTRNAAGAVRALAVKSAKGRAQ